MTVPVITGRKVGGEYVEVIIEPLEAVYDIEEYIDFVAALECAVSDLKWILKTMEGYEEPLPF